MDEAEDKTCLSRRMALFAGLGLAAAPGLAGAAGPGWPLVEAKANALISTRNAPGVQIAVIRKGAVIYSKGLGLANVETDTPVGPQTVFRIGSLTKQFTAAAVLQLQEAGRLSIDDRLARYIPDFPRAEQISLVQMLNHTSGLGDYLDTGGHIEVFLQRARTDYDAAAMLRAMRGTDPMFVGEPGAQWSYSNTGYVLLGLIIEQVTGQSFAEVLNSRLFSHLGMTRTALDDAAEVVPGRATGYSPSAAASCGFANASFIAMSYAGAAGGVRSTCEDLCRWREALFGGRVLSAASLKAMTTPVRLPGGGQPTTATSLAPDTAREPVNYGLGVYVDVDAHGRSIWHEGGIQGFLSYQVSYPEFGVHLAHMVNADGLYLGGEKLGAGFKALGDALVAAALA